ncbi:hypothetical protein [Hoeflea sp.]|uniref:hypothetical protein n=1 Tax=Hoeflea sp. TaxID=1940281 RepID=UPI003B0117C9
MIEAAAGHGVKTRILHLTALAVLAMTVSGCVSESDYGADVQAGSSVSSYSQCRSEALDRYPPKPVVNEEPGYIGDRWVSCGDGSGRLCPPASAAYYADQGTYWDYNRTPRQQFLRRCLSG